MQIKQHIMIDLMIYDANLVIYDPYLILFMIETWRIEGIILMHDFFFAVNSLLTVWWSFPSVLILSYWLPISITTKRNLWIAREPYIFP